MRVDPHTGKAIHLSGLFPTHKGPVMTREAYSLDLAGEYLMLILDQSTRRAIIRTRRRGEYAVSSANYTNKQNQSMGHKQLTIDYQ